MNRERLDVGEVSAPIPLIGNGRRCQTAVSPANTWEVGSGKWEGPQICSISLFFLGTGTI